MSCRGVVQSYTEYAANSGVSITPSFRQATTVLAVDIDNSSLLEFWSTAEICLLARLQINHQFPSTNLPLPHSIQPPVHVMQTILNIDNSRWHKRTA